MNRSPDERHTETPGNLFDIFRRSQMFFSIRRVIACEHTVKMTPRESF